LKRLVRDTSVIEVEAFGLTEDDVDAVRKMSGVRAVSANMDEEKQVLRVQVSDPRDTITLISRVLKEGNVIDMKIKEPTLEDAYLWLVESNA
jgi:ABC-2 type transport system ATP-binding protein